MPFTKEQTARIAQKLAEKVKLNCPSCGQRNWTVSQDMIMFPLQPAPANVSAIPAGVLPPTFAIPCVATTCMICGTTQFYNVLVLGIGTELGVMPKVVTEEEKGNG